MTSHDTQRNDEMQFSSALQASRRNVAAYVARVTQNRDEQRDLIAEVTMRAWIGRVVLFAEHDPVAVFVAHARAVCGEWTAARRREMRYVTHSRVLDATDDTSISVEDAAQWLAWSARVLSRLSAKQRLAVDFRCRWNWPYELIAQALDNNDATVRVHVWRGLRNLRRIVLDDPPLSSDPPSLQG